MKLASIRYRGIDRLCAQIATGQLVDVAEALRADTNAVAAPGDMLALLSSGEDGLARVARAVRLATGHRDDLAVLCSVGGETVAEDSTAFYNYRVEEVLSYLGQFQTLHPGDVVACGTAFKPAASRRSIHWANLQVVPGPVVVRIDGLGTQQCEVTVDDREIGRWRRERTGR